MNCSERPKVTLPARTAVKSIIVAFSHVHESMHGLSGVDGDKRRRPNPPSSLLHAHFKKMLSTTGTTCDFPPGPRRHSQSYTKSREGWAGPLVKYENNRVESLIPPPPPLVEGFKGGKDKDKVYREMRSTSNGERNPAYTSGQTSPAELMSLTACKAKEGYAGPRSVFVSGKYNGPPSSLLHRSSVSSTHAASALSLLFGGVRLGPGVR